MGALLPFSGRRRQSHADSKARLIVDMSPSAESAVQSFVRAVFDQLSAIGRFLWLAPVAWLRAPRLLYAGRASH